MTTLTLINAIIHVGNVIAAAVSGSSTSSQDGLKKSLSALRGLLIPEEAEEKEAAASRAMRILQHELDKGPLVATPKSVSSKTKGRIVRRRGSVNGTEP